MKKYELKPKDFSFRLFLDDYVRDYKSPPKQAKRFSEQLKSYTNLNKKQNLIKSNFLKEISPFNCNDYP